ncbi:oxidoreductase-like domain-containing protein [Aspergillus clavatus NRRL 1]|uniref:Oxidoreductase-like domain-containing protein n=1 Tax=Aspergillus clavatus (strain ATCC 1007 / CBS 513.65 / DSM 816 / NCTC 3887 / NRRL 1 / QM 1276 / 107) TaxID=344612 RepID=A1C918_ASPCL|nr:uncharacterized protein ACLA_053880 [Aspergillus clavatus NRRL 1]EAW13342.1 conserved hypothetical protein [Aspergillus clavatus NRRL 1]
MEGLSMRIRQLALWDGVCASFFRSSQVTSRSRSPPSPTVSITRRYAFTPSSGRRAAHEDASLPNTVAGSEGSTCSQAYPLSGYYYEILSTTSPYGSITSSSRSTPQAAEKPTPATTVKLQTPEEKMAIVFGSRLAGPGRQSRYNAGTMPPESQWKTINGVAIPPRPEEPDNCCMSGCVHCVWDDYRDEMEEWAGRVASAKAKGFARNKTADMRQTPRAEVDNASHSMDDDGGGSETNWPLSDKADDLFADIPVGIREFMKTEKKLKQRHQQEQAT